MSDDQIQIPFAGGPNETLDPRHLPPGSVTSLSNVSYDADGSYGMRLGYVQLGSLVASQGVRRLHLFAQELLLNDGQSLISYNDQSGVGPQTWYAKDQVPQIEVTHQPIVNASTSFTSWASAVGSGYRIVAYVDPIDTYPRATVYSVATGALLYGPARLGAIGSYSLKLGIIGTTAILVSGSTGGIILAFTLALSPLATWSGSGTPLQDANYQANGAFDVAFMSATFALCYQNGAGGAGQTIRMRTYTSALALSQNANGNSTTLTGPFQAIGAQGTTAGILWIAVAVGGGANPKLMAVIPSTLAALAGPLDVPYASNVTNSGSAIPSITVERVNATTCIVVVDTSNANTGANMFWAQFQTTGIVGVSSGSMTYSPASAPLYVPAMASVVILAQSTFSPPVPPFIAQVGASYFLLDLQISQTTPVTTPRWLSTLTPRIVNRNAGSGLPPRFAVNGTGFEVVSPTARGASGRQGLELFSLATQTPTQWSDTWLGKELYIGGGYYDGALLVENGFPIVPTVSASNVVGSGVTYQYCVTWARIDTQGNLEESAPSPVMTVVSGSFVNVQLFVQCLHGTNKQRAYSNTVTPVFAIVYRTPDLSKGDNTFYRVSKEPFPIANANSLTVASITITDTLLDASLTDGTHPVLYTTTSELPHNCPESFLHLVSHKNRIWAIGADQRRIWFSQTYSDGVLPAWHETQTFTVDDTSDVLVGLASMYDKLIIFSSKRIYVVFGDGPSVAGTGSDLTVPQRVASGVGCTDPRSIVNTPSGIMFLSFRGIEVISSDLTVNFIGLPVSVTTKNFPICTTATLCPNSSTVRFSFAQNEAYPSTGTGKLVVYDLRRERWTMHDLTFGGTRTSTTGAPVADSVFHSTLGYIEAHQDNVAGAIVAREAFTTDPNPWLDLGLYGQTMAMVTAWIKSSDLQGWQRVRRLRLLAQNYDDNQVQVTLDYDYKLVNELHNYSVGTIQTISSGGVEQVRMVPGRGKCEALRASIRVFSAGPTGRAASLTGIAFEIKKLKGGFKNLGQAAKT